MKLEIILNENESASNINNLTLANAIIQLYNGSKLIEESKKASRFPINLRTICKYIDNELCEIEPSGYSKYFNDYDD